MNILFLTLSRIDHLESRGIYTDLLRYFSKKGHKVHIVSPIERRFRKNTHMIVNGDYSILKVQTLNIQKTNFIEKGIGTLLFEYQFERAINKFYKNIPFDLILYSIPIPDLTENIQQLSLIHI